MEAISGRRVCGSQEFAKFGHCDLVEIWVMDGETNDCRMLISSLKDWSIVPYIYAIMLVLIGLTVTMQFIKVFFNKYRHI